MSEEIDSDSIDQDSDDQDLIHALTDNRTRWKYHVVQGVDEKDLESTLTNCGSFGWELASIQPNVRMNHWSSQQSYYHSLGTNYYTVVFRYTYWVEQTEQIDE